MEVDVGDDVEDTVAVMSGGMPLDVRFTYAAQSGLGSARGQFGAWQRERSCAVWPFILTGGAQRTLYRLFKDVDSVVLSSTEKPICVVAVLSSCIK